MTRNLEHFESSLAAFLEDRLDAEAQRRFVESLEADEACRRAYVQYLELHATLQFELQWQGQATAPTTHHTSTPTLRRSRSVWYLSAAAALFIAVTAWFLLPSSPPQSHDAVTGRSVAILTNMQDAVFAVSSVNGPLGSALPAGVLQLESGRVQVMFQRGAVVDLTGPCVFHMNDANNGQLFRGRLSAFVPDTARGFSVDLPHEARLIDLGTRFTAAVDTRGVTDLFVTEGQVQLQNPSQAQLVRAGETCRVQADGVLGPVTRLANLVRNPGFEEGDDSPPLWGVQTVDGALAGYITGGTPGDEVHTGRRAVYIQAPASGNDRWFTTNNALIPASIGQRFHLEVWIKTESLDADDFVQLRVAELDEDHRGVGSRTRTIVAGNTDWTLATVDYTIDGVDTTQFRLLFVFNPGANGASDPRARATFDDASVLRLAPRPTGVNHE